MVLVWYLERACRGSNSGPNTTSLGDFRKSAYPLYTSVSLSKVLSRHQASGECSRHVRCYEQQFSLTVFSINEPGSKEGRFQLYCRRNAATHTTESLLGVLGHQPSWVSAALEATQTSQTV